MKSPTLREIAEKARVSISTVSRVLNDQPGIGQETRDRVLAAARELRFRPNAAARSLITRRTRNIGFVAAKGTVPTHFVTASHPFVGIEHECQRRGYHLLTTFVSEEAMRSPMDLPMLREQRVDGLILVGPNIKPSFILALHHSGLPLVLLDNLLRGAEIDAVLHENEEGAYQLTRHLVQEHEQRRVVFLSGPEEWVSSRERAAGYRRALSEAGLEPWIVSMPETSFESGAMAMQAILAQEPDVTGLVAVNDATAIGAAAACKAAGRRVPEEIGVVGFDDIRWAPLHDPPLTTAHSFGEEMGRQAVRRLIDRIESDSTETEEARVRLRVSVKPVIRRSCGCEPGSG